MARNGFICDRSLAKRRTANAARDSGVAQILATRRSPVRASRAKAEIGIRAFRLVADPGGYAQIWGLVMVRPSAHDAFLRVGNAACIAAVISRFSVIRVRLVRISAPFEAIAQHVE